jgi:hypothetical protein
MTAHIAQVTDTQQQVCQEHVTTVQQMRSDYLTAVQTKTDALQAASSRAFHAAELECLREMEQHRNEELQSVKTALNRQIQARADESRHQHEQQLQQEVAVLRAAAERDVKARVDEKWQRAAERDVKARVDEKWQQLLQQKQRDATQYQQQSDRDFHQQCEELQSRYRFELAQECDEYCTALQSEAAVTRQRMLQDAMREKRQELDRTRRDCTASAELEAGQAAAQQDAEWRASMASAMTEAQEAAEQQSKSDLGQLRVALQTAEIEARQQMQFQLAQRHQAEVDRLSGEARIASSTADSKSNKCYAEQATPGSCRFGEKCRFVHGDGTSRL